MGETVTVGLSFESRGVSRKTLSHAGPRKSGSMPPTRSATGKQENMRGTMMDFPLTLASILERAGKLFHRVEIVSRRPDRSIVRTTFGDFYRRARRLADALTKMGLR